MKDNSIFIHIPKTGGTSINSAMHNTNWQTEPNFNYRHIVLKTKNSNAGDIFNPVNFEQYKQYKIFMMLRHPIDRLVSEYYFIQERKNFIDLLNKKPVDFNSYVQNFQTHNGVINFLKGRRFFDTRKATENDLDDVLDAIEQLPIHVGIFEEFAASLQYFSDTTGIQWNREMEVKRMTFKRPQISDLSSEIKELILDSNKLDLELYQFCLEKFNSIKLGLKDSKIIFNKDKYAHVIPYVSNMCMFEFCMGNKKFIKQNFTFFKDLTFYLLGQKGIKDGLIFTKTWNETFINAISQHFPESIFLQKLKSEYILDGDPLEETYKIAKSVDDFFKENQLNSHSFYTPMQFTESLVVEIKLPKTGKKGFLSQLFKK